MTTLLCIIYVIFIEFLCELVFIFDDTFTSYISNNNCTFICQKWFYKIPETFVCSLLLCDTLFIDMLFFISNTFVSNARLILAKNQAKSKKHPEAELLRFKNNLLSSSMLSFTSNRTYSKKFTKKQVCFNEIILIIIKMKMKKRSHRYDINRLTPRHEHKHTKFKMCLSKIELICIKQNLSCIWNSDHEKIKQHWVWVEKERCLQKKKKRKKQRISLNAPFF